MTTITAHPPGPLIASESQVNLLTVEESLRDAELEEVLDDLSRYAQLQPSQRIGLTAPLSGYSRFILNMPEPELSSTERISFQIEQAHWYYEDFVRPLNPAFPSMSLKRFSAMFFNACPLLNDFSHEQAFQDFQKYKSRVPVCGAVLLTPKMDKCVLVKGWKSTSAWSFPKGKINQDESRAACAIREVREETGFDFAAAGLLDKNAKTTIEINEQSLTLYFVVGVSENTAFETQTRKEISKIEWFALTDLPTWTKKKVKEQGKFYLVTPFVSSLRAFVNAKKSAMKANGVQPEPVPQGESDRSSSLGPVTPPGATVAAIPQAVQQPATGPSHISPKPNGVSESDADRMSRLLSALSTGSGSTVTNAAPPPPPSVPMPGLSPSSGNGDRTDKHIALLDSLLDTAPNMPGITQRKISEGRPLPPIPSGSRVFPSNGPAGHPFPVMAPSPPKQVPVPAMMASQPPSAPQMMPAPPPMPLYPVDGPSAYSHPGPASQQPQPSQPPSFLHNPQATYGYYPPTAFVSAKAAPSPQEAHKGALLSLLSAKQPSLPPSYQNRIVSEPVYQSGAEFMSASEDPRAKLGIANGMGMGPPIPLRMPYPSMDIPHSGTPPMHGPLAMPDPAFNLNGAPYPMNNPMGPPVMNMYNNGAPFPPAPGYPPNPVMPTGPPPPHQEMPLPQGTFNPQPQMPGDYPYAGPSSDAPLDAFFPKGMPLPRPREVQNLNQNRQNRVSGEQILYRPQGQPVFPQLISTRAPMPSVSAPMPALDMPKPRQPENLLAILNSGPRPHF
ncbi:hypothetical protein DACRYDRAFT_107735 [Dacryopinax primogenitus]|uniref:Nudix hydrolase domain-containing protein n=1 Tax=Dacryopinax primogenitus (strain DJM 731) TaxID=1858805 RepID=M5GCW7_DACPD|nr:uncharacterized protein DACRYDRAFT_107735 [Dacryopinax primogenitus]EJU02013.1 hypothetical protein DACRYDRAFT_107735 [Dacryopinax primogenitus]